MNRSETEIFIKGLPLTLVGKEVMERYLAVLDGFKYYPEHFSVEFVFYACVLYSHSDINAKARKGEYNRCDDDTYNEWLNEAPAFCDLVKLSTKGTSIRYEVWLKSLMLEPESSATEKAVRNGIHFEAWLNECKDKGTRISGIEIFKCTLGDHGCTAINLVPIKPTAKPRTEDRSSSQIFIDALTEKKKLSEELPKYVFGQQEAVNAFVDGIFSSEVSLKKADGKSKGLKALFLFAGAPGTGKSYLAETAADLIGLPVKKFDMTSYSAREDGRFALFGTDPIWKSTHTGELSDFVWANPDSIVILDEVEKASPDVLRQLLNILSDGEYTDQCSKTVVPMQRVILIMTTNAGRNLYDGPDYDPTRQTPKSVVLDALRKDKDEYGNHLFPPELCSRLASGTVAFFNELKAKDYFRMATNAMEKSAAGLRGSGIFDIDYGYRTAATLLYTAGGKLDGRNVTATASSFFNKAASSASDECQEWINLYGAHDGADKKAQGLCPIKIVVDLAGADEKVAKLYPTGEDAKYVTDEDAEHVAQQLDKLVSHRLALTYEIEHSLVKAEEGHKAYIKVTLANLKLEKAVDAEDRQSFMPAKGVPDIGWDDVIVSDDAKNELQRYIEYLRDPGNEKYEDMITPKGILLYGPPGTGKTTIAKVVAHEAGVSFFQVNAGDLLDSATENVKSLFAKCRKYAPSVFFIDEIDAIGRSRKLGGSIRARSELISLLNALDGFGSRSAKPVFVIAATNLRDELDSALLRRFDRQIRLGRHNREQRELFIKRYIEKRKHFDLDSDDIEALGYRTAGLTPAQIEGGLQTALREALWSDGIVNLKDASDGLDLYLHGERHEPVGDVDKMRAELKRTAIHEAGHIVSYWGLAGIVAPYATIVGRGNYGGYMQPDPESEQGPRTKDDLLAQDVCTSLGGRAAEIVFYGDDEGISAGATTDLRMATEAVIQMIFSSGLYPEFGLASGEFGSEFEKSKGEDVYTANDILSQPRLREKVNTVLAEEMEVTRSCIANHKDLVERLANKLCEKEELTKDQIEKILLAPQTEPDEALAESGGSNKDADAEKRPEAIPQPDNDPERMVVLDTDGETLIYGYWQANHDRKICNRTQISSSKLGPLTQAQAEELKGLMPRNPPADGGPVVFVDGSFGKAPHFGAGVAWYAKANDEAPEVKKDLPVTDDAFTRSNNFGPELYAACWALREAKKRAEAGELSQITIVYDNTAVCAVPLGFWKTKKGNEAALLLKEAYREACESPNPVKVYFVHVGSHGKGAGKYDPWLRKGNGMADDLAAEGAKKANGAE